MNKPCIFTLSDHYLPGYKAGGPIRTLNNMFDQLGNEFRFKIMTRDRDFGDNKHYPGIKLDDWNSVSKADVFYMPPNRRSLSDFKKLLCSTDTIHS